MRRRELLRSEQRGGDGRFGGMIAPMTSSAIRAMAYASRAATRCVPA